MWKTHASSPALSTSPHARFQTWTGAAVPSLPGLIPRWASAGTRPDGTRDCLIRWGVADVPHRGSARRIRVPLRWDGVTPA